jgi:HEAT repeat protein
MMKIICFLGAASLLSLISSGCLPMPGTESEKPVLKDTVAKSSAEVETAEDTVTAKSETAASDIQPSKERTLMELRQNLSSKDPVQRVHAVFGLQYFDDRQSIDEIRKLLQDKNPSVQKAAILALAQFKEVRNLPVYYVLYQRTDNIEVKRAILKSFQWIHDDSTIAFLEKSLGSMGPYEASLTFELLAKIDKPKQFSSGTNRVDLDSFVISGVIGRGETAKIQVERDFFAIGDKLLGYTIRSIDPVASIVRLEMDGKVFSKEIDTSSADEVEKAIAKLNSSDDKAVYRAILDLVYHQSGQGGKELIGLVEGTNSDDIRLAAVHALGATGVDGAEESLKKILRREKRADFLALAAISLTMLGYDNALEVLEPLAQHSDPWVRNAVVTAMGITGSPHSVATLIRMLSDTHSFVRNNAYEQLMSLAVVGGLKNQIVPMLISTMRTASSASTKRIAQNLFTFLQGVDGGPESSFNLSQTISVDAANPEQPVQLRPAYTPKFILLSIGQFGTRVMANVVVGGEQQNVFVGSTLDGMEIVKIDPDEEFLHLKMNDGRIAVVESGDSSEDLATLFEIQGQAEF